jgi:glycosyltransferase involved in cell wall biosynthesis
VVVDGENGLLVDFFSPDAIANAVGRALAAPDTFTPLRLAAVETVRSRYDQARTGTPGWLALIDTVARTTPGDRPNIQ